VKYRSAAPSSTPLSSSYDLEEMRQIIDDGLPLLHRLIAALKESEVLASIRGLESVRMGVEMR
jgi:hypothetical protein